MIITYISIVTYPPCTFAVGFYPVALFLSAMKRWDVHRLRSSFYILSIKAIVSNLISFVLHCFENMSVNIR